MCRRNKGNMLLKLSLTLIVVAAVIGCVISPIVLFVILAMLLVALVYGAWLKQVGKNYPEAEQWCNCGRCSVSFTTDGRIQTFTPKLCAPMGICPDCELKEARTTKALQPRLEYTPPAKSINN